MLCSSREQNSECITEGVVSGGVICSSEQGILVPNLSFNSFLFSLSGSLSRYLSIYLFVRLQLSVDFSNAVDRSRNKTRVHSLVLRVSHYKSHPGFCELLTERAACTWWALLQTYAPRSVLPFSQPRQTAKTYTCMHRHKCDIYLFLALSHMLPGGSG